MYLGLPALLKARKAGLAVGGAKEVPLPYSRGAAFAAGTVATLLNPKVDLFNVAVVPPFIPQFIPPFIPQFIPHGGNTRGTALLLDLTLASMGFFLPGDHRPRGLQGHEVAEEAQGQHRHRTHRQHHRDRIGCRRAGFRR